MTDITPKNVARMLDGLSDKGSRRCFAHCGEPDCECDVAARQVAWAAQTLASNAEAIARAYVTLSARLAEVEATLKLALPHLEENARWHRDAQSHAQKCEAAFAIVAAVRAALQGETK